MVNFLVKMCYSNDAICTSMDGYETVYLAEYFCLEIEVTALAEGP